ncbi:ATP-binding cassette domain-containing protein [Cytophagaceae bacterium ABcell3]|nr:ATP-binding cassette domain-containing protein [Cytophagaceae bacterium ABcell3]
MNNQQIIQIIIEYQRIFHHKASISPDSFEWDQKEYAPEEISAFIQDLTEAGNKHKLVFLQNDIDPAEFEDYLIDLGFPILIFLKENGHWVPVSIYCYTRRNCKITKYYGGSREELKQIPATSSLLQDYKGKIIMLATFQFNSLVSMEEEEVDTGKPLTPVQRFFKILSAERRDITYIYLYAVFIGLIALVPPLGVQAIISQIAGGVQINTIWIVIGIVIVAVLFSGGLQVMQLFIVEMLQRRVFTKAAYEFAFRIPRLKLESIQKHYAPELINRFFDILTIQKGLPKILLDISAAALQIVFGLILLFFYHFAFIVFGIILIIVLLLIFYVSGPKGLKTSLQESKHKYKVVYWLEELARALDSFKLAGNSPLPIRRTDQNVNNYLDYREKHFKVLITQYIHIILFKTIVIGGLLIIGSLLVIDRQITLGQFVASELIVVIIVSSVEKIIMYVDIVYDTLTAAEKVGNVTDLPLEKSGGIQIKEVIAQGMHIKIRDLKYKYPENKQYTLNGLNLDIQASEKIALTGVNGSGKSTLINILAGVYTDFDGIVAYNNIPIRDIDLMNLRSAVGRNISLEDIFDGTILENITLGLPDAGYPDALEAAEKVRLLDFIQSLPEGFHANMLSGGRNFPESVNNKIILARCIVKKPKLLLLNNFFRDFEEEEKKALLDLIIKSTNWTLVAVTNDPLVQSACDKTIVIENGKIEKEVKKTRKKTSTGKRTGSRRKSNNKDQ